MRLYVAGVRHHDPMGRPRLLTWLKSVMDSEGVAPEFLGIEYDRDLANVIIGQRPKLLHSAPSFFLDENQSVYGGMAQALGYEADTHLEIIPDVDILWVDPTTSENALSLEEEAHIWSCVLDHYNFWLSLVSPGEKSGNLLQDISKGLWSGLDTIDPQEQAHEQERDNEFACRIRGRMERGSGEWAAVVLGSDHADPTRMGSAINILQREGVECVVMILNGV